MRDSASVLVIPGQEQPGPAGVAGVAGAWVWPAAGVAAVALAFWAMRGRRARAIDPRELAFRRLADGLGLSRSQVRALRQEAAARGMASPVGLAVCPALTAQAVASRSRTPGR